MKKKVGIYSCNEGKFRVELLKDNRPLPWSDGETVRIKLLEPIPFQARGKLHHHVVGDVLYVGHWQVKEEK